MGGERLVGLAVLCASLLVVAGCTETRESFKTQLQQKMLADSPESLTDCAKSAVRRPPVIAAVTGGVQGVAIATGTRMAVCAVQVSRADRKEEAPPSPKPRR